MSNSKDTTMNQAATKSLSNMRWFHKICAYVLSILMVVYPVAPTFASVVDNWMISDELNQNPYFIYSDTTEHLYEATPFIDQPVSSSQNLESFYQSVLDQYREGLEPPTYVPIMVGDITTIIPIYKKYKYVGTPIVQERYIRSQIYQLLGRTLIDSEQSIYASETAQINTLYDNALTYLRSAADVTFGQRLALQVDNNGLSYNFVWPELRELNGQEVLVPIVYLSEGTVDDRRVTSNVNEINGDVTLEELIVENVSIQFGRDSFVNISKNLVNKRGAIEASGDLDIAVGGALQNLSGLISANNNLQIGAQSITNETIVYRYGDGYSESTGYSAIAEINATNGNILLRSYGDIIYQGASSTAGGAINLTADGNIYIGTQTLYESTSNQRDNITTSDVSYLISSLSAEETIDLIAGSEILIEAADIVSRSGHITLLAAMGITIKDSLAATESKYQKGSTTEEAYKAVAMRSLLDAGMSITIHAEFGDINLKATELSTAQGTNVTASNGAVNLLVTKETDQYSYSSVSENLFTTTTINRGQNNETIVPTTIVGGFVANPLYGLNVEYEGNSSFSFDEQIDELAKMPGLEYLDVIRSDGSLDIDWFEIEARYEEWNKSNTSLSAAAIAIISIAVAVATGGAGAGWTGAISNAAGGGALGAASSAAFVSIATATTIAASNALLNGEDPFEAAFQKVTDDDALKSAAIAAVTAGAIAAIDAEFFSVGDESFSYIDQAAQVATHAAVSVGVSTLVSGGDLGDFTDQFISSLLNGLVSKLGSGIASEIGEAKLGDLSKYLAHAALGCGLGALNSEISGSGDVDDSCASGSGGAVIGELTASLYADMNAFDYENEEFQNWKGTGVGISELTAAFVVTLAGGDASIAAMTGKNAAEHNALSLKAVLKVGVKASQCLFAENVVNCISSVGAEALQTSEENNKAFMDGIRNGYDEELESLSELDESFIALYNLVVSGDLPALAKGLQAAVVGMGEDIIAQTDAIFTLAFIAESPEEYQEVGKNLFPLIVDISLSLATLGTAKAVDVLTDIASSARYIDRTDVLDSDLNGDGDIDVYDLDLNGDDIPDNLGLDINPVSIDQVNEAIRTDNRASLSGKNGNRISVADCSATECVIEGDDLDEGAEVILYQLEDGGEFYQSLASASEKALLDEVIQFGDLSGDVKEKLAQRVFERNGLVLFDSKYTFDSNGQNFVDPDSPHGLDLVFEDPNTGYIVVVESKPFDRGAFNLQKASALLSTQMSDLYIRQQTARMRDTMDVNLSISASKIEAALNDGTLRKIVSGVDTAVGSFVMVPLD